MLLLHFKNADTFAIHLVFNLLIWSLKSVLVEPILAIVLVIDNKNVAKEDDQKKSGNCFWSTRHAKDPLWRS